MAIEAHRHAGVFIARGKEDALVTKNLVPGNPISGCPFSLEILIQPTTDNPQSEGRIQRSSCMAF